MTEEYFLNDNQLLLAKLESSYGVDPVPTGALNALLAYDIKPTPDVRLLTRKNLRGSLSPQNPKTGQKLHTLAFTHELRGNGDLSTDLRLDPVLRCCGLERKTLKAFEGTMTNTMDVNNTVTQAVTGATGVVFAAGETGANSFICVLVTSGVFNDADIISNTGDGSIDPTWMGPAVGYIPRNSDFESACLYHYTGAQGQTGILHKMTGAFASVALNAPAGDYGSLRLEVTGLWNDVGSAVVPTATVEQTDPPIMELAKFKFGGYASVLQAMSINLGVGRFRRQDLSADEGLRGIAIGRRDSKGSINPEAVLESTHDFWARMASSTTNVMRATYGMAQNIAAERGNRIHTYCPSCSEDTIDPAERDSVAIYNIPLTLGESTEGAADEFRLTFF